VRWARHAEYVGGEEQWWESQEERDHWETLDVDERIILSRVSYKTCSGLDDWIS
jgi:hypothetical protein